MACKVHITAMVSSLQDTDPMKSGAQHLDLNGITKRPRIHLVNGAVINIGRESIWQHPFPCLAEILLLICRGNA